ncbi:ketopantoate hydroxymethyltransferase [Brevibacillus laterosporus]|uniref:ketopantoate hydroxymethyltransferase n=1 Tax=Brevibacillus laterosporus TaxID=1465 RepID=UPI000CE35FD3|nr:ketopantoate hydroxymethyltransferase [Brevibacillus laterosporus]PPA85953.1 ketopantoate hydroxymethyltransferase [Brevibacillus laterosporus]
MITNDLILDTTNFVKGKLKKITLNGSFDVTGFTVTQDKNLLFVQFSVSPADVQLINLIEIRDSESTVVSSSVVYVPINSETIIKHTITVKEG